MQSRIRYTRQNVLTNTFYQMPQFLFTPEFSKMTNDARVMYTLMLDRHRISIKNNWFDENGEVFIYFKREKMQEQLNLSKNTIGKLVKELKSFALVEEKQQGLNKPNRIYLLSPVINGGDAPSPWRADDSDDSDNAGESPDAEIWDSRIPKLGTPESQTLGLRTPNNCAPGIPNSVPPESQILTPSNNKLNNNEFSNNKGIHNSVMSSPVSQSENDGHDGRGRHCEIETYTARIKENIGYDDLSRCRGIDISLVDNFVSVILDTIFTQTDTVRIGKEDKPLAVVKSVFLKLDYRDIEHAVSQFQSVTERITNKAKYIRTMLYNCKLEGDAHYTNAYMADRYE